MPEMIRIRIAVLSLITKYSFQVRVMIAIYMSANNIIKFRCCEITTSIRPMLLGLVLSSGHSSHQGLVVHHQDPHGDVFQSGQ